MVSSFLYIQTIFIEKKIIDSHSNQTIFINTCFDIIFYNDKFFEGIIDFIEGFLFLLDLFRRRHFESRLDIIFMAAFVGDEVNFQLLSFCFSIRSGFLCLYDAHIYPLTSASTFCINNIFHNVIFFLLPEVQSGVAESYIFKIIFRR